MATAAAPNNTRAPREVVEFPPDVPVTVALKYSHAKTVSSQYGERFMFSLADGRVMFLAPDVRAKIEALGINVRENFTITRRWYEQQGSPATATWELARLAGEQPNGTSWYRQCLRNQQHRPVRPPVRLRGANPLRWSRKPTAWWTASPLSSIMPLPSTKAASSRKRPSRC